MLSKVYEGLKKIPGAGYFTSRRAASFSPDICCIEIFQDQFTVIYAHKTGDTVKIKLCESHPFAEDGLIERLSTVVRQNQLNNIFCSWILQPEDYQLLVIDALPVLPAEFQTAARWKIKEFVHYPIEDTTIDSFPMPRKSLPNAHDMIAVIVARTSHIQKIAYQIKESGLNLQTITIPEVMLKNILYQFLEGEKGGVLVYMQGRKTHILIGSHATLYFMRTLDFGLVPALPFDISTQAITDLLDKLALEIQRSLDYYQGQWRQPVPHKILFSVPTESIKGLCEQLQQRLTINVEPCELSQAVFSDFPMDILQQSKFLPLIGGVIGYESRSLTPND